jgi:hypothetical protein
LSAPINQVQSNIYYNCVSPSPSLDGRYLAVKWQPRPDLSAADLLVLDRVTGRSNLVTVSHDGLGGANHFSSALSLSFDGRYVAFISQASNLVPEDTNGASDAFVRDMWAGKTLLLSADQAGRPANGATSRLVAAPNGRTVYFHSYANDLVPGDFNLHQDIFAVRLSGSDTDHDELEDEWELAYFSTLSRDGAGDFDGDGTTDAEEYRATTDPTNADSILRVLTLSVIGSGTTKLIWSASPGRTYQLQFKEDAGESPWIDLGAPVVSVGSTGTAFDLAGDEIEKRFYRVSIWP